MERQPPTLPRWMLKYINQLNEHKRINKIMDNRYYPAIMDLGPDEISRYILDFINPIHKPPTKFQIWKQNRKKKWCKTCGEYCPPVGPTCQVCLKPFSWICQNCQTISPSNTCRPRIYPPTPEDSDYSASSDYD